VYEILCLCPYVFICVPMLWYVLVCVFVYEVFVFVFEFICKYKCASVPSTSRSKTILNILATREVSLLNIVMTPTWQIGEFVSWERQ
jgi:hypothetical protein